jgi:hypothetical protein
MVRRTFMRLWSALGVGMGMSMSMVSRQAAAASRAPGADHPSDARGQRDAEPPAPLPWLGHTDHRRPRR